MIKFQMTLWINRLKNLNFLEEILVIFLIFSLGFLIGIFGIEKANFKVFDEFYFIDQAKNYLKKEEFFDGHPPLAKLIFALLLKISGWPEKENYFLPRILFLFFSSFLGILGYILIKIISKDKDWATISGVLLNTETALLFFRKFLLLEIVWINFSLLALIFLLKNKKNLFFIFWGLGISVKWFSILFIIFPFFYFIKNFKKEELILGFILIFLIYFLVFEIHYGFFLDKKGLEFIFLSIKKFIKDNFEMFINHSAPTYFCYPLASFVLGWPFGIKNISSAFDIFPNILLWNLSLFFILKVLLDNFKKNKKYSFVIYFFTLSYISYFLFLILIEYLRPGFLYYYFGSLIFAIFILSYFVKEKPILLFSIIILNTFLLPKISGYEFFEFEKPIYKILLNYMEYGNILFRNLGIILKFGWF